MKNEKIVMEIMAEYRPDDSVMSITKSTILADFFGQNEWYTLGQICLKSELEDEFHISIPDDFFKTITIGDVIKLVNKITKPPNINEGMLRQFTSVPG